MLFYELRKIKYCKNVSKNRFFCTNMAEIEIRRILTLFTTRKKDKQKKVYQSTYSFDIKLSSKISENM